MQATRDFSHYVKDAGAGLSHIDLAVEGVSCAGCMSKIERGLSAIPDVTLARVNLTDRRVALEWKQGALDPARFIDRLAELGYKAYPFETAGAEAVEAEQSRFLLRCLGVAAFATMNVMMLSIPVWSGNVSDMIAEQRDFFHWLSALIALPAAAYAGQPFFRSAWRALAHAQRQHGRADLDRRHPRARHVGGGDHPPRRACLFRRGDHAADIPAGRALSRPEHAAADPGGGRKPRRAEGGDRDQIRRPRRDFRSAGGGDRSRRHRAAAAGRTLRGRRHRDRGAIRDRPEPDHRRDPPRRGRAGHRGLCGLAQHVRHVARSRLRGVRGHAAGGDHPAARQRACRPAPAMCASPTARRGSMRRWCMPPRC